MSDEKRYLGGCHCGAVRYSVLIDLSAKVISCNCSMCGKKGTILSFVPAERFELQSGADALSSYQWGKKHIDHLFCSTCGVTSFARGKGRDGSPMAAINTRCLDDVDVAKLDVMHFDGASR